MKKLPVLCVLVMITLLAAAPVLATHSWGGYHWARTNTSTVIALKMGNNLTSGWQSYFGASVSEWSQSTVFDLSNVAGGTTGRKCRPAAGRDEVCNASYGNNGWLGLAQIWLSGGHISQGTVKVNDTYFTQAQYNNANEKNHVMCQEIGHTLGLDHTSTDGSSQGTCMDYSSSPSSTAPNSHDYSELVTIYNHNDGSNSFFSIGSSLELDAFFGSVPPAMTQIELDGPGQWGTEVERSEDGKESTYVLDFGNDNKIVTFVRWADDAADGDTHRPGFEKSE